MSHAGASGSRGEVGPAARGLLPRWVYAAKPGSWPKLLVPFGVGQAIGAAHAGRLQAAALLWGLLFTLCGLLFIVLLNDWGDREVDALKRRMFPDGCSPKTIPDGILSARALLLSGLAAGAVALAAAWLGAGWLDRPLLGWAGVLGMTVFWAYTLPPLRLNYRGGGELLEMLGVGALLPWINAYGQSGQLAPQGLWVLPGLVSMSLASALASTLSDEDSDRAGGKTTAATRFGNAATRRAADVFSGLGIALWAGGAALHGGAPLLLLCAPALVVAAMHYRAQLAASPRAVARAFAEQGRYKGHLHRAIWHGALLLCAALLAAGGAS
ncbi:MAG: prenyltransferase [Myxococcales bacterium]|jgi:1,4-dihydroxy-2-naphthoate octaprenyltransferase/chlorophyll synthase